MRYSIAGLGYEGPFAQPTGAPFAPAPTGTGFDFNPPAAPTGPQDHLPAASPVYAQTGVLPPVAAAPAEPGFWDSFGSGLVDVAKWTGDLITTGVQAGGKFASTPGGSRIVGRLIDRPSTTGQRQQYYPQQQYQQPPPYGYAPPPQKSGMSGTTIAMFVVGGIAAVAMVTLLVRRP